MSGAPGPARVRDFLDYWALGNRAELAAAPLDVVKRMDRATQQVVFVGLEDLIGELSIATYVERTPGRLAVYIDPPFGDEARWQLATLFADVVVLRRPIFDNPPLFAPTVRELCEPEPEGVIQPGPAGTGTRSSGAMKSAASDYEAALDDILEWEDYEPVVPREDQLAARLPSALAAALRFAAHLAAVGDGAEVVLVDPDLSSAGDVVRSLEGVYYDSGAWRVHDSWVGGFRPDTQLFGEVLREIAPERSDTLSVLGAYAVGMHHRYGHLPLVAASDRQRRLGAEFFGRFARLHFGHAMMETGPRADPFAAPGEVTDDRRPALSNEMVLTAFPHVRTADLSTFEYLHALPSLTNLRRRLRTDAERVENCSATELETRMSQIAIELSDAGGEAANQFAKILRNDRLNLRLTWLANAVTVGAGFIAFGPIGAIGGGAIAASVSAALERRKLDPQARFTGSELGLLTLSNSANLSRKPPLGPPGGRRR